MLLASALLTLFVSQPPQDELAWSRFRGPNGSGVAAGKSISGLLHPRAGSGWRTELPPGYSSPVLTADCAFVTGVEDRQLVTFCIERDSGDIRWARAAPASAPARRRAVNCPAAPTPTTDGENVYVFFEDFGLLAYDAGGVERWRKELGPFRSPYGMGSSPVLFGETLLLSCDQDVGSYLLAVDAANGEERWRAERPGFTHGYSSPVVHTPEEGPAQVVVSGSHRVVGYSLETGEELWWVGGMAWQTKTTPVVAGGVLYVHSWMASPTELGVQPLEAEFSESLDLHDDDGDGALSMKECAELGLRRVWFLYDLDGNGELDAKEWEHASARAAAENGLYAVRLGDRGDITQSAVLWQFKRTLPNIPSPILYDDVLFVLKEGGVLVSLDPKSGETIRSARIEGAQGEYYASPVAVGGKLITASKSGVVALIQARAEWELLSLIDFGEEIWATPAPADGELYVRTREALYCLR